MSFLEILAMVRDITAAFKARDWAKLATLVAAFIGNMLENRTMVAAASPEDRAELDTALAEMNAAACSC